MVVLPLEVLECAELKLFHRSLRPAKLHRHLADASLLDETAQAIGGLGPALQRLVDSTQSIVGDFQANISDVNDIIENSAPIVDSQVDSGDSIERWSHNLNVLTAQVAQNDQHVRSILTLEHHVGATDRIGLVV